jgi:quercetin dioxygenase-like cupin family protein
MRIAFLIATMIEVYALYTPLAKAQDNGFGALKRTELLSPRDFSVSGREISQTLVEFSPNSSAPRHSHPGEELVYVAEGTLEYDLDGQPPAILNKGESLLIPYGVVHGVKNVGSSTAVELGTYVVEKGKPLITLAK